MDSNDFVKQQFITLREEIKETKSRIFKIQTLGLVIMPSATFLGERYRIDALILTTPLLAIVVSLMFLFETNALMRCGKYIKDVIEPGVEGFRGWEEWLGIKEDFDKRKAERFTSFSFLLLFVIYFIVSSFLAYKFAIVQVSIVAASLITSAYVAVGVWFFIFLVRNVNFSTD